MARPLLSVRAAEGAVVGLPAAVAAPVLARLASRPPAVLLLGLSHTKHNKPVGIWGTFYSLSEPFRTESFL